MAIFISKFLGPIILTVALPMIFAPERLQATSRRFLEDAPLVLVSGVLAMTAGLAIVNASNVWTLDWRVIVTLFGWALLIGGAVRIVSPGTVAEIGAAMIGDTALTRIVGVLWGALGAFLTIKAYA